MRGLPESGSARPNGSDAKHQSIYLLALAEARRGLWNAKFWTKSTEPESLFAEETVVDNPLTAGWMI